MTAAATDELSRTTTSAVAGRIRRLLALADNTAHRNGIPDTTTALTPNMLDQP